MPKQLRLDVAQLTDVGRKREHNEDNMAHVIPKDPQVMARKGALFIVADGMGGHAAGEVASEIAVDAVTNVYYQDDSDDVAISLLHAIKRANAMIHQRAAENMLRSGMGTTCVAAVLCGSMAYIANVGDSRAYLVRNGQVRQISQDHSWVAEQVRAGLLSEEQARTHAQRNVITRCLGTQAEVEVDVFSEPLEENDALVLCTDGLSGSVSDDEIRRAVEQTGPQESVYHLIEQANENGGPDNITAIVVRVQEVGWEPPTMRRSAFISSREMNEDTAVLGTLPAGTSTLVDDRVGTASGYPLHLSSGPLSPHDSITAPQPAITTRRGRLFYPTLALLVLLVVVAVGTGAYYFYFVHTTNGTSIDQSLQNTGALITRANGEAATNPTQALHDLATAQSALRTVQSNVLTSTQRQKVMSLQGNMTSAVQAAITQYNQQFAITTLTCPTVPLAFTSGSNAVPQMQLTTIQTADGQPVLYALGTDAQGKNGTVYQVSDNSLTPVAPLPLPPTAPQVVSIAGDGQQLLLLSSSAASSSSTAARKYFLSVYVAGQKKAPPAVAVNAQSGSIPTSVTAAGSDVYVIGTSPTASTTTVFVQDYKITAQGKLSGNPTVETLTASNIVSVAAFPQQHLFFLLADGSIHSLQFTPGSGAFTSVFIQHAIPAPLAAGAANATTFTSQTPVPTASPVSQHGLQSLSVGASTTSSIVAGQIGTTQHLYVMDAYSHRLLDFTENSPTTAVVPQTTPTVRSGTPGTGGGTIGAVTTSSSSVTLNLVGQYIAPTLFTQLKSMAVAPDGSEWSILSQGPPSSLNLLTLQPQAGSQAVCTSQ